MRSYTFTMSVGLRAAACLSILTACQAPGGGAWSPRSGNAAVRTFAPAAYGSVNWPQFRFDDNRTGFNPHEKTLTKRNVPRLGLAWQAQLGSIVVSSSPAVVNDVVYIASTDGRLWAYPATGCGQSLCTKPLWTSTSLGQVLDSPTVVNGMAYVGSQTSASSNDGKLDAFSATGCGAPVCAPLWQGLAGTESILQSSPAVAKGNVFVGAHDGKLYVFNAGGCGAPTCLPTWTATTGGPIESTPTISGNVLYVGSDDGKLYAFAASGCNAPVCTPKWTGALPGAAFDSSPAVSDNVVYIAGQHGVAAFKASGCGRRSACKPLWRAANDTDFFNGSPAIHNGHVFVGVESELNVYAAAGCGKPTCNPLWIDFGDGEQAVIASSPTVANGVVYAGRNTGEVLAWPERSCGKTICETIWKGTTNEQIVSSSPTVVNGRLYIGSADNQFPSNIAGRLLVYAVSQSRSAPIPAAQPPSGSTVKL